MMSEQFGWEQEEQLSRMISGLRGEALTYVARLTPDTRMWLPSLLVAMEQRFGDHVLPETYRATLMSLKKSPKENLREYESQVRQLMTKAYPGLDGTQIYQTMAVEYICNGLPDPNMAFDILTKKPKTIAQAIDMIEWYECCKNGKRRSVVRQVTTENDEEEYSYQSEADIRQIGGGHRFVTEDCSNLGKNYRKTSVSLLTQSLQISSKGL